MACVSSNGEVNANGNPDNRSWNCGAEGPTDDETVLLCRQQCNFIATLMLSQGVPMLLHGDELGRTQQGNSNAYCQGSELTWIDWGAADSPLAEFTATATRIRRQHPLSAATASSKDAPSSARQGTRYRTLSG